MAGIPGEGPGAVHGPMLGNASTTSEDWAFTPILHG